MTTTTAIAAPPPPIQLATGDTEFVGTLLRLHHDAIVVLPDALVDRIRAADTLERARRAVAAEVNRQDPSTTRRAVVDGLKSAAAAGTLPDDAGAAVAEHQRDLAVLEARYEVLTGAATEAGHELRSAILSGADALGDLLAGALARTLAEAEPAARIMRDAGPFGWTRPDALLEAAKPVQAAYAALVPLAAVHDRLRAAAVSLAGQVPDWDGIGDPAEVFAARQRVAAGEDPEWRRVSVFGGYGVEQSAATYDRRWTFKPTGHPVQRLVAAATDPAPAPLAEPALAEA